MSLQTVAAERHAGEWDGTRNRHAERQLVAVLMARGPIYAEIKRSILQEIDSGIVPEGSRLTPEVELAARFGVSRPTVRQAILELAREGVLARRRGHGTVVLPRRLAYPVGRLMNFGEEFASSGSQTSSQVVDLGIVSADADLAVRLGTVLGRRVFRLERVRYVDERPVARQRSHIVHARVPGIETIDFTTASLYETLRDRYRLTIASADEVIRASTADASDAEHLGVAAGSPVFRVERRGFTSAGDLVEVVDSVYRSDRYEIRLVLRR
jgi:GntR family transcriptional regulator